MLISNQAASHPFHLGLLYSGDLLGHHRQHLHVNTVKLIKASPGTGAETWKTDKKSHMNLTDYF